MKEYFSQDITFCTNNKCKNTKCERNPKNIKLSFHPVSCADFENTEYCPKKGEIKMAEYHSIFKCRLCGKQYESGGVCNNRDLIVNETIKRCIGAVCKEPQMPSMTEVHLCENGDIGIADFQGWERRV